MGVIVVEGEEGSYCDVRVRLNLIGRGESTFFLWNGIGL